MTGKSPDRFGSERAICFRTAEARIESRDFIRDRYGRGAVIARDAFDRPELADNRTFAGGAFYDPQTFTQ